MDYMFYGHDYTDLSDDNKCAIHTSFPIDLQDFHHHN